MVKGYKCFKCMDCGKGFRVRAAGLIGENFKVRVLKCTCGSDKTENITPGEYNDLVTGKDRHDGYYVRPKAKPPKKTHRGEATKLYGFENHVPLTTEKREGAKQKTEVKYGKKKRKERQSDNSGRSRRLVVTR